jgi:hypothetical protein
MCIFLRRSIKIEKKCDFVEMGEEFEKTKFVIEKDKHGLTTASVFGQEAMEKLKDNILYYQLD